MGLVAVILLLIICPPATGIAAVQPQPSLALANVSHTLDGRALIINGWVENRGPNPVTRLVIDASGFSPSGDLTAFGSDGIPWEIAPSAAERFTIAMPIGRQLIREYVVQVSSTPGLRPAITLRRGVEIALYRSLLLSLVRVRGDIQGGLLTVRSEVAGLPITQLTVRADVLLVHLPSDRIKIIIVDPKADRVKILVGNRLADRIDILTVDLDVPAEGVSTVFLGVGRATLLSLRVVDVRLKTTWTD